MAVSYQINGGGFFKGAAFCRIIAMENKGTVLITGASSGIGLAAAGALLKSGYRVYAGARRLDRMQGLKALGARTLALDVTDEVSLKAAVDTVLAEAGAIDVLVNSAGYGAHGAVEDVPLAEARRQFEVNLFGLARLTQLALPGMRARGAGRIINISSIAGKVSMPTGGWYHASKHALEAYSDALRMETAQFGIKVVLVEPGPIKTEWDGTAIVNLQKYSGSGPYAPMVKRLTEKFRAGYRSGAPGPETVARVIVKAAGCRNPAPRYAVPFKASLILLARWLVPDRLWDLVIRMALKA
jgi:NAD(P)-dependent dehydrogenase (short-subunit alcohol dehydrogenase family)